MAAHYLVLQPAFLGDAILTVPLIGQLKATYPAAEVHWVVRAGTEELFVGHPWVARVWPWDKSWRGWWKLWQNLQKVRWEAVLTVHRYFRMGLLGRSVPARTRITFDKNPLSWAYTHRVPHIFREGLHEVERNLSLLGPLGIKGECLPAPWLFPPPAAYEAVRDYLQRRPFIVVAPTSRWPTKEAPFSLWEAFIRQASQEFVIYLTGLPSDRPRLNKLVVSDRVENLAGQLSLPQLTALIAHAHRVFTVDSATTHIASAMGTPATTVFCATVPGFGFGPLGADSYIVQTLQNLRCRPCSVHGPSACPMGHFLCGHTLSAEMLLKSLTSTR